MRAWRLTRPEALRAHLAQHHEILEPRADAGGSTHWLPNDDAGGAFDRTLPRPLSSPKQCFFAERETLFQFDGHAFRATLPTPAPFALFGVRACDLAAIAYQDRFFTGDPCYQARRSRTLLVGLDCTEPCAHGFCRSVDTGPMVRTGTADLVLHADHDGWLLIEMTDTGERAVNGCTALTPAPDDWQAARAAREAEVSTHFPDAAHITQGVRRLNAGGVSAETWETLGVQCLACSGCTLLCPTCSCYATYDRPLKPDIGCAQGYSRERCWDSCLYEGFQREASGHNPSLTAGQRVERFWYHKFSDDFLPDFGRHGCVGCGRCEQTCIGHIGVHTVMRRLAGTETIQTPPSNRQAAKGSKAAPGIMVVQQETPG